MITEFKDKETEKIFNQKFSKKLPNQIQSRALIKLMQIDNAEKIDDLKIPPSNHLELLSGDRAGQYSIRINNQWRICFVFSDKNASQVEITDYH